MHSLLAPSTIMHCGAALNESWHRADTLSIRAIPRAFSIRHPCQRSRCYDGYSTAGTRFTIERTKRPVRPRELNGNRN
jgi:hypothetical protein